MTANCYGFDSPSIVCLQYVKVHVSVPIYKYMLLCEAKATLAENCKSIAYIKHDFIHGNPNSLCVVAPYMEVPKSIETRSKFSMHADKGRG